ncbi:MAG: guanylate kinase [Clostridia bacterium]|nr:guanylate kinase [Clostridia bacterium]
MEGTGLLLVLSGPSGAGKGTLCRALMKEMPQLSYSISATTRPPRPGETHGKDYYFVSRQSFQEMLAAGEFLEWAEVYNNYYGTPKKAVLEALSAGKDLILEIDIQGALQVKSIYPQAVFIFILPPSFQELEKRIIHRGKDSEEAIRHRLSCVEDELHYIREYDYVVVNDQIPLALEKLKAIIIAEKCRPHRQPYVCAKNSTV